MSQYRRPLLLGEGIHRYLIIISTKYNWMLSLSYQNQKLRTVNHEASHYLALFRNWPHPLWGSDKAWKAFPSRNRGDHFASGSGEHSMSGHIDESLRVILGYIWPILLSDPKGCPWQIAHHSVTPRNNPGLLRVSMLTKGAKLNTYTPLIQETLGKLCPPTFNSLVSHACAKPIAIFEFNIGIKALPKCMVCCCC